VADELINTASVRLMMGAEFFSKNLFSKKPEGETEEQFQKNSYRKV